MWVFKGNYTGEAKEYIKRKEKKIATTWAWFFSILIVVIFSVMAITLGDGDPTLIVIILCGGLVYLVAINLVLFFYQKREPKSEIEITNDGINVSNANGSYSIPFYKCEPIEYYDDFIVIQNKTVLQQELLVEGSWEELKDLLKKVEDSLDSDEPMYQIEEPETEFFEAKVKDKRIYKQFVSKVSMVAPVSLFHYFVTFELENGEEIEYEIGEELYKNIEVEQTGTLVIVSGNFFSFGDGEEIL